MEYKHHGVQLDVAFSRDLDEPHLLTDSERLSGVTKIHVDVKYCEVCRRKFYFVIRHYGSFQSEMQRLKKRGDIAAMAKRLELATESDWVWGYDPTTYQKVKRFVR